MAGTAWSDDDLARLGAADELSVAVRRGDGSLMRWTPIWVVVADGRVFVRTWHRRTTGWYGRAVASGRARVRVPGLEADVTVQDVGEESAGAVDAAYRAKYGRYGDGAIGPMVAPDAVASTLRLSPGE
jgi:hypothetical protein